MIRCTHLRHPLQCYPLPCLAPLLAPLLPRSRADSWRVGAQAPDVEAEIARQLAAGAWVQEEQGVQSAAGTPVKV
eukprot:1144424-Rhodomonas_salina.7